MWLSLSMLSKNMQLNGFFVCFWIYSIMIGCNLFMKIQSYPLTACLSSWRKIKHYHFAASPPISLMFSSRASHKHNTARTLSAFIRFLNNAFCVISLIAFKHTQTTECQDREALKALFLVQMLVTSPRPFKPRTDRLSRPETAVRREITWGIRASLCAFPCRLKGTVGRAL